MRTKREFAAPAPAGAVWAASFLRRSQPSLSSREVSPQATEGGTLPSCCAEKSEEFCSRYAVPSPLWWKGGGGFAAGGMLPTAHLKARRETPSRQRSFLFFPSVRPPALVINRPLEKNKSFPSNIKFINFSLCRSGRGRPPLFFSRKEKGERNDRGLRPLTPSGSTYTSAFPASHFPREAYLVALLRRQGKAAWCFPRKSCFRSDRYVS